MTTGWRRQTRTAALFVLHRLMLALQGNLSAVGCPQLKSIRLLSAWVYCSIVLRAHPRERRSHRVHKLMADGEQNEFHTI